MSCSFQQFSPCRQVLAADLSVTTTFLPSCVSPSAACDHQGHTIDVYISFATQGREAFPKPTQLSFKILGLLVIIPHVKQCITDGL